MREHERLIDSWKSEFKTAYDRDSHNGTRQSFDEYWKWVKVFLVTGGAGQSGWLGQADGLTRRVRDDAARATLRDRLHTLGKTIGAEWSKEGRVRRIHSTALQGSPNLAEWGRALQRSAASERGDGAALEEAIARIERDIEAALGGKP